MADTERADIDTQMLMSRQGQSRLGEDSACFTASTLSNLFAKAAAAAVGNLATLLFLLPLLLALLQSSSTQLPGLVAGC